jgi:hypothetical protein
MPKARIMQTVIFVLGFICNWDTIRTGSKDKIISAAALTPL